MELRLVEKRALDRWSRKLAHEYYVLTNKGHDQETAMKIATKRAFYAPYMGHKAEKMYDYHNKVVSYFKQNSDVYTEWHTICGALCELCDSVLAKKGYYTTKRREGIKQYTLEMSEAEYEDVKAYLAKKRAQ